MGNYNYLVVIIILLFLIGMKKKSILIYIIRSIFRFWDKLPPKFKVSIGVVEIPCIIFNIIIGISLKHLFINSKEVFIYLIMPTIAALIINIILPSYKNIE